MTKKVGLRYANQTYEAEREYWNRFDATSLPHRQLATPDATKIVEEFLGSDWTLRRTTPPGRGWCRRAEKTISVGYPTRWLLAHEIAHGLDNRNWEGRQRREVHDSHFRFLYLRVVETLLGAEWEQGLREAFEVAGLSIEERPEP